MPDPLSEDKTAADSNIDEFLVRAGEISSLSVVR